MAKATKEKKARAIGVAAFMKKQYKSLPFEGEWARCMGQPCMGFKVLIAGDSSNGKTTFTSQFCKMLAGLGRGKVAYNSIEEGDSSSMQQSWKEAGMADVVGNIQLIDREPIDAFIHRLNVRKTIRFAVIDSVQMSRMSADQYDLLKKVAGKRVALIFISHVEGKLPKGAVAKDIRYDADIKIFVEGFVAQITSRYGSKGGYIIWRKEAENYWGAMLPYIEAGKSVMQARKLAASSAPKELGNEPTKTRAKKPAKKRKDTDE
jgi:uridine kinase